MPLPLKSGHTFDHFFAGRNAGTHLTREGSDELFDAVRLMLEDCDRVSCINMMVDIDDGFGGLGVQILEYLRDEVHGVMMVSNALDLAFWFCFETYIFPFVISPFGLFQRFKGTQVQRPMELHQRNSCSNDVVSLMPRHR